MTPLMPYVVRILIVALLSTLLNLSGILAGSAFAADEAQDFSDDGFYVSSYRLTEVLQDLAYDNKQRSLLNAGEWASARDPKYQQCVRRYQKIFADDTMFFTLSFGYADSGRITLDAELYEATRDALTRDCADNNLWDKACGFKAVKKRDQYVILQRKIDYPNPMTGEIEKKRVRILLTRASADDLDAENLERWGMSREQEKFTQRAKYNFFCTLGGKDETSGKECQQCDICSYFGHARNGGGPDFQPVPNNWRLGNGKPNYDRYEETRYMYRHLLRSMQYGRANPPSLVAVFACYSKRHFYDYKISPCHDGYGQDCRKQSLADFVRQTPLILTEHFSYFQNWEQTVGVLIDGSLNLRCQDQIQENYDAINMRKCRQKLKREGKPYSEEICRQRIEQALGIKNYVEQGKVIPRPEFYRILGEY